MHKINKIFENSVDPDLFINKINDDYKCYLCGSIPKRASNIICCGQISCKECLFQSLIKQSNCPKCLVSCTTSDILPSPYIGNKISGLEVKCPYYSDNKDILGCDQILTFGKEGVNLIEHVNVCDYSPISCPDCQVDMNRLKLRMHKPINENCPNKIIKCEICEINMPNILMIDHVKDSLHFINASKKHDKMIMAYDQFMINYALMTSQCTELKKDLENVKSELKTLTINTHNKIASSEIRLDQKINELRLYLDSEFIVFEVNKWSQISNGTSLYSSDKPLIAWGIEWQLKVEKAKDRIGLYLCCGEAGKFPVSVNYRLTVRKRDSYDSAYTSISFNTEFGKEKAWGVPCFTNIDNLLNNGGYNRTEDTITFGCVIYPIKGLLWGQKPN